MDCQQYDNYGQHNHWVYLQAGFSIINLIAGALTKSNLAWGVGIAVGISSLYSAHLTQKEKKLSIKKLKKELNEK